MLKCKKDFETFFQKGCMYEIFIEFDDCYWIFCDDVARCTSFSFCCHEFLKENDHRGDRYFNDYFCDIQEVRKQKLDKIKEVVSNSNTNESTL